MVASRSLLRSVLAFAGLAALVAACAPAVDGLPEITVINAPAEMRVAPLAEELEQALAEDPFAAPFRFTSSRPVRWQEVRREMHRDRAPLQAAFIARNLGGAYAVMVGAPTYEREVRELFGDLREVAATVQVRAQVVDPETAEVIARFDSRTFRSSRLEPAVKDLPDVHDDPDVRDARHEALRDIAMPLATELANLVSP